MYTGPMAFMARLVIIIIYVCIQPPHIFKKDGTVPLVRNVASQVYFKLMTILQELWQEKRCQKETLLRKGLFKKNLLFFLFAWNYKGMIEEVI